MSLLALLLLLSALPSPPADEAAAAPPPPFVLVLAGGSRVPLLEPPRWAFGRTTVRDAEGRRLELAWSEVDHEATRAANPEHRRPATASRVWTLADLERLHGSRLNVLGSEAPSAISRGSERGEELAAPQAPAGEAQWRGRAQALGSRIAGLEATLDQLERARDSWESFTLGTGGDYASAAASKLGEIRRARETAERLLRDAQADRARLEEEARLSSVPPGWLR